MNNNNQHQQSIASDANDMQETAEDFLCSECGFDAKNEQKYIANVRSHLPNNSLSTNNANDSDMPSSNREFVEFISKLKQTSRIVKGRCERCSDK